MGYLAIVQAIGLAECLYAVVVGIIGIEIIRGLHVNHIACFFQVLYFMVSQIGFPLPDGLSHGGDTGHEQRQKRDKRSLPHIHILYNKV